MAFGEAAVSYSLAPLYIRHTLHVSAFFNQPPVWSSITPLLHLLFIFLFYDGTIDALMAGRSWGFSTMSAASQLG